MSLAFLTTMLLKTYKYGLSLEISKNIKKINQKNVYKSNLIIPSPFEILFFIISLLN